MRTPATDDGLGQLRARGIEIISTSRSSSFEEDWYDIATDDHFWLQWRLRASLGQIRALNIPLGAPLHALDVGCGRGVLRTQFEAATRWTVDSADLNRHALLNSVSGRGRTLYYDVLEEKQGLAAAYDIVLLYDVLEHIEDPKPFLRATVHHIKPGGWIFINVPALESFRSKFDQVVGHCRRYDTITLPRELEGMDIKVIDQRYWGMTMLPMLFLRKQLLKAKDVRKDRKSILEDGFRPPSAAVHSALRALMRLETSLIHRPPLGTSLLLAGRRCA